MKKTLIALGVIVVLLIGGLVSFVHTHGPDYASNWSRRSGGLRGGGLR